MWLNNHSCYSFKYGVLTLEELLQEAQTRGLKKLSLTEINGTSSAIEFIRQAPKYDIEPVVGIDFRNGVTQLYIGLALNNEGFFELNSFLSPYLHEEKPLPARPPEFKNALVIYPDEKYTGFPLRELEYVGVQSKNLIRFRSLLQENKKLIALHTNTFRNKKDFNTHRLLRAIANNTLLSKLQESQQSSPEHYWISESEFLKRFESNSQLVLNAQNLLEQCTINFDFTDDKEHKNQKTYTGNVAEDYNILLRECEEGLKYRYPIVTNTIRERLNKELDVIRQKDFVAYFLINWDIVRYARSKGYYYIGRGSGANSIIAYLLRITDVDPIELDLYFERFINLYRKNPPDFDIDFSWKDREDVTRYIFNTFDNVALLATYNTFQYRAVIRELGKVFGLPPHEIDNISGGGRARDSMGELVLKYGDHIKDLPGHLSVHAGGILISEKSIYNYSATSLPPKGFPITHFDMYSAEDIGLYKFDILGQRGLAKIKEALELVQQNHPEELIDLHDLKRIKEDTLVHTLLRRGEAIGCFYIESPGMRMLLKKLRTEDYMGLVAASSVIRPGVSRSGMMREYIQRYRIPEKRKDAHPVLLEIMPDTYGVMVYQEDVIKVAHYFAGLSLAEADVLRRGMSGKYRSRDEFQAVKDKFLTNCKEKGYTEELTADVWRQIESFAGYAFAKGHSASYAVESFQSLFLKAYHPLEFLVSVINNGGGFYSTEFYIHEAKMHGAVIEAPCVNNSVVVCSLKGKHLFLGLGLIKELEQRLMQELLHERETSGHYKDLTDLVNRLSISLEQLNLLIKIGAFRFTGSKKQELYWQSHLLLNKNSKNKPAKGLFDVKPKTYKLPALHHDPIEDAYDQMELLGFSLYSPFELFNDPFADEVVVRELPTYIGKEVQCIGYLVTVKNTTTIKKERMHFGTFLDREGEFLDTVHFPYIAQHFPFRGRGMYLIKGRVVEEFDTYSIEVQEMEKLSYKSDPRYA